MQIAVNGRTLVYHSIFVGSRVIALKAAGTAQFLTDPLNFQTRHTSGLNVGHLFYAMPTITRTQNPFICMMIPIISSNKAAIVDCFCHYNAAIRELIFTAQFHKLNEVFFGIIAGELCCSMLNNMFKSSKLNYLLTWRFYFLKLYNINELFVTIITGLL